MDHSSLFWLSLLSISTLGFVFTLFCLLKIYREQKRYLPLILLVVILFVEVVVQCLVKVFPSDMVHLLYVTEPFTMLQGALIFIYTKGYSQRSTKFEKVDLIFLIPFVLSILSYLPYYVLSSDEKLLDLATYGSFQADVGDSLWEWNFEIVLNSAYLFAALLQIQKYNFELKDSLSNIQKVDLHLTRYVIYSGLLVFCIEFIFVYLTFLGFPYSKMLFKILSISSFLVLIAICYDAIISHKYSKHIIHELDVNSDVVVESSGQVIKYAKSTLDQEASILLKCKLEQYMDSSKPYLIPQLRIKDLSDSLNVPLHHLSQVINEYFHQNFYEFINDYRVSDAKRLLMDSKYSDYTLSAIGFEVGFNSKSAFYNAFKKNVGVTPMKFKDQGYS
ncbi:helix-turn-helix domain-containing protein [Halosquirtibacter xylanolyticus]|uniref:helix-turn-helix domain-containing protein n=1 Tax=Halosquirtibacter xylanolyticus TaxID=3374599 RepID=UPI0037487DA8|nr:helix-turn-helix domain-containing protein [Prolixibacteraceae bacterium]